VSELTPELRTRLNEPGAVVIDAADLERLGLRRGAGDVAEVNGQQVRVVSQVSGLKGLAGPYVFCSLETARRLLGVAPGQVHYLLVRCKRAADVPTVRRHLGGYGDMTALTSAEFSFRSRCHWLLKTGAGVSLGCAAVLGLLVGAVVTSQTLYAATTASLREYAVLRAMGIPRRRVAAVVMAQSFWIGVAGITLAVPAVFALARLAEAFGAKALLPAWLLGLACGVTLIMAVLSGLASLRSLRLVEPAALLR
jgi:putative ABC transport system permease protein